MNLPDPLMTSSPERMGGTPVFAGTRVPVQTLFDLIEDGALLPEWHAGARRRRARVGQEQRHRQGHNGRG